MARVRHLPPADPYQTGHFHVAVPASGYHWVRAAYTDPGDDGGRSGFGSGVGELLMWNGVEWRLRTYDPLAIPDLFRVFADTRPDKESILAFANQYGKLGVAVDLHRKNLEDHRGPELLDRWQAEIRQMRTAVRVWDAYQTGREKDLRPLVCKWGELGPEVRRRYQGLAPGAADREWYAPSRDETGEIVDLDLVQQIVYGTPDSFVGKAWLAAADRRQAAKIFLADAANEHLYDHCRVELNERPRLVGEFRVGVRPRDLLGAMWWQVARLVTGDTQFRGCKVCGQLMEVSTGPHGVRTNRAFCSNACKVKDHRAKVRKAKAMRARGRTVAQIARHFETKPAVIENWLTKKK